MKAQKLSTAIGTVVPKGIMVLALFFAAAQFGPNAFGQQSTTVIRGGTLIDGNGGPPVANSVIVIEGNRIRTISQGQQANLPAGATVIDATGKYITPGLWDTHTHYHNWFPELVISSGVTSVLAYDGNPWLEAQAEGTAKGKILGPRFFMTYPPIGFIYMGANDIVKDPEMAVQQVRERVAQGAKMIKVYTSVTPDVLRAVTREAHRLGLKVSGHIGMTAREAAMAEIDNLAHATGLPVPDLLKPEDLDKLSDMRVIDTGRLRVEFPKIGRPWNRTTALWGPLPDLTEYPLFIEDPRRIMAFGLMDRGLAQDLINLLVKQHVAIESCIGYTFRYANDHLEEWRNEDRVLLTDPNLGYIPERYKMNLLDYSLMEKFRPDELELMKKGYRNFQWFTKTFVEAGGKITTGMDTSSSYHATMMPGLAVRREMQLLVEAGLTPMQAIQSATKWAAELLQANKDLGTLEAGKVADLVILRRNPLQDITAFKEIDEVMKDGRVMPLGYHYDYQNPIPEPGERQLGFVDWLVSEIPTRITSISPTSVTEGDNTFTLTIRGQDFVTSSVVQLGSALLKTEFVDSTQLKATVPADLLSRVGTYPVRVVHRAPAWGTTNAAFLIVKFR